jgi:RecA-family ATPase
MPKPEWLIENLFERNSLVMLAGPPNSFKSFLLIDWLLCMAVGRKWLNRPTVQCKVAYALGEGKASLMKRIQAWAKFNELSEKERADLDDNFKVTFDVPQLASSASTDNMLADLSAQNYKPEVIAIDTFTRSFVGKDENDAKDVGVWVEQADKLRQNGYTVIFLHHTKKNTEFGVQYRGSTAIKGAMDTAFTLTRDGNYCSLTCDKQKDHDEGPELKFRKAAIPISYTDSSLVLVPAIIMDSRFSEEEVDADEIIIQLIEDGSYESDVKRAEVLSKRIGIGLGAAKARISRGYDKIREEIDNERTHQEPTI